VKGAAGFDQKPAQESLVLFVGTPSDCVWLDRAAHEREKKTLGADLRYTTGAGPGTQSRRPARPNNNPT